MHLRNILLALSAIPLSGCQPETPKTAQPVAPPVATQAATPPAAVEAGSGARPVPAVSEADALQLIKKNNCFACHAANKKIVGPSFMDIAAKYRGDAEAETRITEKIARGGSGVWGVMVMPPGPQIGEADRRIMAAYILSLK